MTQRNQDYCFFKVLWHQAVHDSSAASTDHDTTCPPYKFSKSIIIEVHSMHVYSSKWINSNLPNFSNARSKVHSQIQKRTGSLRDRHESQRGYQWIPHLSKNPQVHYYNRRKTNQTQMELEISLFWSIPHHTDRSNVTYHKLRFMNWLFKKN